nr:retrotransposon protein, putative, Ty1-copia subclass [Tanacetum cinerariifolium]
MARATSTKSWLRRQRLSHLSFDTINYLAKNDLIIGHSKFKYDKEHLCPSYEQGKSKKASHPPKPVPNSKQRLHLLHMNLCGPMRVKSINGNWYVLVIVDDYSCYTWVHFLISKHEAPEEIKTFMKKITVLLQASVIIVRTNNVAKFKNQVLKECFDSVGISHQTSSVRTPQQNRVVERRNHTIYNRRTKKIMQTINVTYDELSSMDFDQRILKPEVQSMTFRQITSGLDLTYDSLTITSQKPTEHELDLLFEAMYDDYISGQPSAAPRTYHVALTNQVFQTPTTFTTTTNTAPTPTNSSSQAENILNTSQDVDELEPHQQHVQKQDNQAPLQPEIVDDNAPNAMFDGDVFEILFALPSASAVESSSSQYVDLLNMHRTKKCQKAMTDPEWIDSMQEELLQFKRLDVSMLVPAPDKIKPLSLKWLFKNKHDEENTVIRNKTHLVVRGYHQDEGKDFEESFAPEDILIITACVDLLTKGIEGFKTYDEYKDDWIYEWNKDIPWVDEKPWTDTRVWTKPAPVKHYSLMDCELKEQALRNKAIMEGLISNDESSNDGWRIWESHEIIYHDHDELEYKNETHDERQELCEAHEFPVCNMRRFKMIKYSFGQDEEYVTIKEDEYDDLVRTSEDACRAYQEIFRMIDEGWMPRPDAIARFLTSSLDRLRRRLFMPATLSPRSVNTILQEIWCRITWTPLENTLDFEDEILDAEVQENEATPLSDEEIALYAVSQGAMASGSGGEKQDFDYDLTNYGIAD